MAIAGKHGLKVVEDCAQALDARINGQHVGTFGDYGCFSFHGAKTMTTLGEGGMLTVKSDADAALVPGIRHNGCCAFDYPRERYWVPAMSNVDMDIEGFWPNNFCIGEVQCALGSEELKTLTANTDRIIAQNDRLRELLKDVPEISFNKIPAGYRHVRPSVCAALRRQRVRQEPRRPARPADHQVRHPQHRAVLPPLPLPRSSRSSAAGEHDCPVLEAWWDNTFTVPMWCGMDDEVLVTIADSVKGAIADLKAGK